VLGEHAGFDPLGQFDFVGGAEQGGLAYSVEIYTDEVGGRALGVEICFAEENRRVGSFCRLRRNAPLSDSPGLAFESLD
jgi:hypothetical protein